MRRCCLIVFSIAPVLCAAMWIRSEFITDLLMRRAPVVVQGRPVDLSRGVGSTRGCILFRRIVISPGRNAPAMWDWSTTRSPQIPEARTPANRLGFGEDQRSIASETVTLTIADSWFPYWLAEIIVMGPLLIAIPFVRTAECPS